MQDMKHPLRFMATEDYFSIVREQLSVSGEAFVRVTGNSMRPVLRHLRDGVIISPAAGVRPGDVVLYDRRSGRYALHRVIRVSGERFWMMGDNQWYMDRGLPRSQIMGKVTVFCRNERRIPASSLRLRVWAAAAVAMAYPKAFAGAAVRRIRRRLPRRKGMERS